MRDCLDRWVTSPTWGPPPPCKQALRSKEAKWQRLPRRWSCYIGSEKRGFWTRISTPFSREIPHPTSFINIPNIICHFRFSSMLKFWRIPHPGVAVKSRIPSTFSRIPHCILVKSRIPGIPLQTLLALCVFVRSMIKQPINRGRLNFPRIWRIVQVPQETLTSTD